MLNIKEIALKVAEKDERIAELETYLKSETKDKESAQESFGTAWSEWRTTRPSGHLRCVPERFVTHWMPLPTPPKQSMEGV